MFPLVPYLLGEKHPLGTRLANIQRCLRTSREEIEEIGDNRHTLMFEMMGNWSLGDYFKKEQINNLLKMYVEVFKIDPQKIYVSVFAGNETAPQDSESIEIWKNAFKKYGVEAEFSEDIYNIPPLDSKLKNHNYRIFPYTKKNWWQRGDAVGEPGGPDSEVFYDLGIVENKTEKDHINSDSGRFIEIGNSVFMQYRLNKEKKWEEIKQKNVDFGGGFERLVMIIQNKTDIYETDLFVPIISKLEEITGYQYKNTSFLDTKSQSEVTKAFRIIADHIRGAVFILGDGIKPSNKDQGYVLRSLIRRMIRYAKKIDLNENFTVEVAKVVLEKYDDEYPHLKRNKSLIFDELDKEEINFSKTINKGLKELQKYTGKGVQIDGKKAFYLYETYGFPIEMIIEEIKSSTINDPSDITPAMIKQIENDFKKLEELHREKSRVGATKKFTGGLADQSTKTTRLHTAHHLLLASLQKHLGNHVKQKGSNITGERLRIDVSHDKAITKEELLEVEKTVNDYIKKGLTVRKVVMPKAKALQIGAEMEFGQKYGELVNVYLIEDANTKSVVSKEFCGGPHVKNTKELLLSGQFKIIKEQSNGSGVRRIKAVLTKND